ncbi:MAG: hypothetical protein L0212_04085 [Acidobacteria bacterium]|nr:hypothetical protein [Acidobacteriota bacterium]
MKKPKRALPYRTEFVAYSFEARAALEQHVKELAARGWPVVMEPLRASIEHVSPDDLVDALLELSDLLIVLGARAEDVKVSIYDAETGEKVRGGSAARE